MAGIIAPGTPLTDAVDNASQCTLLSCDGSEASLGFKQLQKALQDKIGADVSAPDQGGMTAKFNEKTAGLETKAPAVTQPGMTPDLIIAQQQNYTAGPSNG